MLCLIKTLLCLFKYAGYSSTLFGVPIDFFVLLVALNGGIFDISADMYIIIRVIGFQVNINPRNSFYYSISKKKYIILYVRLSRIKIIVKQ